MPDPRYEQMVRDLMQAYNMPEEQARAEVEKFLNRPPRTLADVQKEREKIYAGALPAVSEDQNAKDPIHLTKASGVVMASSPATMGLDKMMDVPLASLFPFGFFYLMTLNITCTFLR